RLTLPTGGRPFNAAAVASKSRPRASADASHVSSNLRPSKSCATVADGWDTSVSDSGKRYLTTELVGAPERVRATSAKVRFRSSAVPHTAKSWPWLALQSIIERCDIDI